MKKRSLLTKTMSRFVVCIAVIFALTAPLFYWLTKCFYAEDMIDIVEAVNRGEGIPPLDLERDIMEGMTLQYLLIFLVVSISLFITTRFVTRRLWLPFDDTLRKTERFNIEQDELPEFAETDIREFSRLNHSLQQLMQKDRNVFRIQTEFTENASHELQTPLAIIRSKLDLLMQENLTENQMQLVSDMYDQTMRIGRLNRNLLLLARIDNAQYTAVEDVDVVAMIADSLPSYSVLQKGRLVCLQDQRERRESLRANPVLLECLLKNLIVNAVRYSALESEVRITVGDDSLLVENVAEDGNPLNPENLFRRFSHGSSQQRGNGLGLAIVKAVCDYHGWKVDYHFDSGFHCFTVHYNLPDR